MIYTFQYRPLPAIWPSGPRARYTTRSRFKAPWHKTMNDLERELRQLDAPYGKPIIVEAGYYEHEIRQDGLPRANARPHDPAIILNFESRFGPLRYGCDTYDDHLANLRAIALALEALRAVDRYGVTKRGEQYQGWKALPANTMSRAAAENFLRMFVVPGQQHDFHTLYRLAAKKLHPDVGGDKVGWEELQRAKEALGL